MKTEGSAEVLKVLIKRTATGSDEADGRFGLQTLIRNIVQDTATKYQDSRHRVLGYLASSHERNIELSRLDSLTKQLKLLPKRL